MKKRHQGYIVTFCSGGGGSGSSTSICSANDQPLTEIEQGGKSIRRSSADVAMERRKQDSSTNLLLVEGMEGGGVSGGGAGSQQNVARIRDKFRGCLLGALVGDCVGTLFERDYSVSYTLLEDLYHSLTNLSEDEKLMDMHGIDLSLGPKRVRELLDTKRQSYALPVGAGGDDTRLKPPEGTGSGVQQLRRNSAFATGTAAQSVPKEIVEGGGGSRRGSTSRPMERYSDDTVMTKSVLYSLIACKGFEARHMAKQLTEDYFMNMNRKFGGYIRDIFTQLRETGYQDPYGAAKKCSGGIGAQGNEAASRVSPVALFCAWPQLHQDREQYQMLIDMAGRMSKITNAQRASVHGTVLQALAVHAAFNWEFQGEKGRCRRCGGEIGGDEGGGQLGLGAGSGTGSPRSSSRSTSPLLMRRRGSLAQQARNSLGEVNAGGTRILVEQQPKYFCEVVLERMSGVEGRASSLFENLKHLVRDSVTGTTKELLKPQEPTYCDKLRTVLEFLQRSQPPTRIEVVERLGNGFKAIDSVPTAVYSFLFAAKNDYLPEMATPIKSPVLRTIFHAISLGGETDTLASMAGAIAGAYWGAGHIPAEILRVSEGSQDISKLADELFNVILKNKVMSGSGGGICNQCYQSSK